MLACTLTGCVSDTNSAGTTGGCGFNTNACTSSAIVGCSGNDNMFNLPGAQLYGIQVAGTQTDLSLAFNSVTGSGGQFNYVSGGGYLHVGSMSADFSGVGGFKVPSLELAADGVQALTTGGTILTSSNGILAAIPVSETGAVSGMILEAPSNPWSQVTIMNQSAFTITFAAAGTSHVADGVSDVIPSLAARTFVYNSNTSLWQRCG